MEHVMNMLACHTSSPHPLAESVLEMFASASTRTMTARRLQAAPCEDLLFEWTVSEAAHKRHDWIRPGLPATHCDVTARTVIGKVAACKPLMHAEGLDTKAVLHIRYCQ